MYHSNQNKNSYSNPLVLCTKTRENLGNEGTLRDAAYCGFNIKKSSINPKRNCLFSFEIHIWTHQSILQNPS